SEPASLELHWLATVLASLLRRLRVSLFAGFVVDLGNVTSSLAFGIVCASEELAIASELYCHRRTAVLTFLIGQYFLALHVAHVFLGARKIGCELTVKLCEGLGPSHLSFFDLVQLFFHVRRVFDVEQIVKTLDQQVAHDLTQLSRVEPTFLAFGVLPVLN